MERLGEVGEIIEAEVDTAIVGLHQTAVEQRKGVLENKIFRIWRFIFMIGNHHRVLFDQNGVHVLGIGEKI